MLRAFRAEWTKLRRRGQVLGSWGTMVGFGVLFAVLLLANASDDVSEVQQRPGEGPTLPTAVFETEDGGSLAFRATGQLLGIIALVVGASNVATEYSSSTLKSLLVREPRRSVLLGGKLVAVWSFVAVGIGLTLLLSFGASVVVASARGLDASSWWSASGLGTMAEGYVNVTAAALVWALMGAMLATVFRSGFAAIGLGIAYPLIVEGLLGLVFDDVVRWMPGSVLGALAQGSSTEAFGVEQALGYGAAIGLAVLYAAVFAAVSLTLVVRRDVT